VASEQAAAREAGADRDRDAAGGLRLERRDRRGLRRDMAQARHEHAGPRPIRRVASATRESVIQTSG
jgi:hypothetical protein